jgi:hypothetical protein
MHTSQVDVKGRLHLGYQGDFTTSSRLRGTVGAGAHAPTGLYDRARREP